eukprot:484035_1
MKKLFKKKNQEIEKQMKLEQEKQNKTLKILLLGPETSGKSTLLKQIHRIDKNYDEKECQSITPIMQCTMVKYMKTLCEYYENTSANADMQSLQNDILQLEAPFNLTKDIAHKIQTLWNNTNIKETLKQKQEIKCPDSMCYFMNKISEIACDNYCPSFDDYLRIYTQSKGLEQTNITADVDTYGEYMFEFTDIGGQKSEITKWIKFIAEDIHAVVYVISLSDYDKSNYILEAIQLFKTIATSNKRKFFKNKPIYIMFNKFDKFKEKITNIPISVAFDDFPNDTMNPNDQNDAVRFIGAKFLQILENENIELVEPLHVLRSNALSKDNVNKIFVDISENLVNKIRQIYIM